MYPAKLLLFGEYSILLNSDALAIPFDRFQGEWAFIDQNMDTDFDKAYQSNLNLKDFLAYLIFEYKKHHSTYSIDIIAFEDDLINGLYFKSDIPEGSGLGSSGALIAAIFNRYVKSKSANLNSLKLKKMLALLESFYHGTSSGIDPLVSILNKPVLIKSRDKVEQLNISVNEYVQKYDLFVVESQQDVKTGRLVDIFKNKCKSDPEYISKLHQHYIPVNNECIHLFLKEEYDRNFFSSIRELSRLQLSIFNEMIPENFVPIINHGLQNNLFYLKLCGSGGGYLLGFTENIKQTRQYFNGNGYEIFYFK